MSSTASPSSRAQALEQLEDLRLDGDVERGGRLVGEQQSAAGGERHGDHHPLALAARELVRVVVEPAPRVRQRHQLEQPLGLVAAPRRA